MVVDGSVRLERDTRTAKVYVPDMPNVFTSENSRTTFRNLTCLTLAYGVGTALAAHRKPITPLREYVRLSCLGAAACSVFGASYILYDNYKEKICRHQ